MKIKTLLFLLLLSIGCSQILKAQSLNTESKVVLNELVNGFITPHESNNLWCYWYWINDDISKEGITKDLKAMRKAGIGAALIGNINPSGKDGKVPMLSDNWWAHMVHAVVEGKRIGVDIGIFNCPGWSQSGGPWVDATKAMRYLTYSEVKVKGNQLITRVLEKPKTQFQDTHVLAFKSLKSEEKSISKIKTTIQSNLKTDNLNHLIDGDLETEVVYQFKKNEDLILNFDIKDLITARQITINPSQPFKSEVKLFTIVNGKETLLKSFTFDRIKMDVNVGPVVKGALAISLPNVISKKFKLVLSNIQLPRRNKVFGIAEINISEAPVLQEYMEKQLGKMHPTPTPKWNTYLWNKQKEIPKKELYLGDKDVIDISDKLNDKGLLTWLAPKGDWTIMRFGMTPTGTKNSPSAPQGRGYEIDKMSSELAKYHFDNFVGELLKRLPEESKSAFKYVIADSYEMGSQNWTDDFEITFEKKYGYSPVKYLPVLSGRIVGSVEQSDRFLWDLRRAIADDVAYEYVGGLREASNKHNLKTWLENYGHWGFPSEFMMYGGQSDLISGEFWNEGTLGNIECKASSSTAHTYGKRITSAEAFTSSQKSYMRHPEMLKKRGDWSLTQGINHFVLHLYIQQPDDHRKPGMNAWFGTEFNRHNTWFSQANNYFDYLRRCQHLLQKGLYAADVCYFIGENTPIMTGGTDPAIPEGHSYDFINAEVILNRLSVKNGRFVLPDGMSYKVMVLPPFKSMRPEVLKKIEALVKQGGIILGQQPEQSPSLKNYPDSDKKVQKIAGKIWGGNYVNGKLKNNYGKGFVFDGYSLEALFEDINLRKDFNVDEKAPVLWTHRKMADTDIYFISNQSDETITISPSFRVDKNLKPQLWDAVTGEIRDLVEYSVSESGIKVPLKFKKAQSWFVVFSSKTTKNRYQTNFPKAKLIKTLNEPFIVDFKNKEIGPKAAVQFKTLTDWSTSLNDKIKYYSGTATYKTTFTVDNLQKEGDFYLNLGALSVMAEVKLNGKALGGVWIAPYRLNITNVLKKGLNTLEIDVVNLWRNQLIKDKNRAKNEKYTWLVTDDIKKNEPLKTSGLLGPIVINHYK